MAFFDTHCHVAFMAHPIKFVRDAHAHGSALAAVSVTPQEFHTFQQRYVMSHSEASNVTVKNTMGCAAKSTLRDYAQAPAALQEVTNNATQERKDYSFSHTLYCGLGLHPWWVPSDNQDLAAVLDQFDALLEEADFIGEVGLDFSVRWSKTRAWQLKAIEHILNQSSNRSLPVSLHCVRAYDDLLALLQKNSGVSVGHLIFHWFSGTSDQLQQAIKQGCFFSVSARMLATKRGRAYVQAIPMDRLLLETDAPEVSWDVAAGALPKARVESSKEPASAWLREPQSQILQKTTAQKSGWEDASAPCISYSYAQLADLLKKTCDALAQLRSFDPYAMEETLMTNARKVFSGARNF